MNNLDDYFKEYIKNRANHNPYQDSLRDIDHIIKTTLAKTWRLDTISPNSTTLYTHISVWRNAPSIPQTSQKNQEECE